MSAGPESGRDRAIDVLRGLCIVSMTTAHLAAGSWPWQIFHIGTFIDGAVGFVFLSGLVLGITQRRAIERGGLLAGQRKLLRRIVVIYCANIALCLLAFATVAVDPARESTYPSVDVLGRTVAGRGRVAESAVQPALHLDPVAVRRAAAARGGGRLWAAVAAAGPRGRRLGSPLYRRLPVAGPLHLLGPARRARAGELGDVATAVHGGAGGRLALAQRAGSLGADEPSVVLVRRVLVLGLSVLGWRMTHGTRPDWATVVFRAFTEGTLAPGTIVMAFAAVLVGYRVCRRLGPRCLACGLADRPDRAAVVGLLPHPEHRGDRAAQRLRLPAGRSGGRRGGV